MFLHRYLLLSLSLFLFCSSISAADLIKLSPPMRERAMAERTLEENLRYQVFQFERFASGDQAVYWQDLQERMQHKIFDGYVAEVLYLQVETGEIMLRESVPLDGKPYQFVRWNRADNDKIIPLVVMRPAHKDNVPVAIYTHGGPNSTIHPWAHNDLFPVLAGLGFAIVCPNYRGSSLDDNFAKLIEENFPAYPIQDLQATIAHVKKSSHFDSSKLVLTGISFGTFVNSVALEHVHQDLAAVLLLKGAYSDERAGFNLGNDIHERVLRARRDLPVFLAHGALDDIILPGSAASLAAQARQHFIRLESFFVPSGDHHLAGFAEAGMPIYDLSTDKEVNWKNVNEIFNHARQRRNSDELHTYLTHVTEFLRSVIKPQPVFTNKNACPYSRIKNIADSEIRMFSRAVVDKGQLNQTIKKNQERSSFIKFDSILADAPYSQTESMLKLDLGALYVDGDLAHNIDTFFRESEKDQDRLLQYEYDAAYGFLSTQMSALVKNHNHAIDALYGRTGNQTANVKAKTPAQESAEENLKTAFAKTRDRIHEVHANKLLELAKIKTSLDENHKKIAVDVVTNEINHKGLISFYHGASAEVGNLYDVYSLFKNLLMMTPDKDITRLRMLDDAFMDFLNINDVVEEMDESLKRHPGSKYNYLPGYEDLCIAGQLSLFGGSKLWGVSTFLRYFLHSVTGKEVSLDELLAKFFDQLGLVFPEGTLRHITENYTPIFERHRPASGGRLLQIIAEPALFNKHAYISEVFGFPLKLKSAFGDEEATHQVLPFLHSLCRAPEIFEGVLRTQHDAFKHQRSEDRIWFHDKDTEVIHANFTECRFLTKPALMDSGKLEIFSYHVHDVSTQYLDELKQQIAKDMALWLAQHRHLSPSSLMTKSPLMTLYHFAEAGQSGSLRDRSHPAPSIETILTRFEKDLGRKASLRDALQAGFIAIADFIKIDNVDEVTKLTTDFAFLIELIKKDQQESIAWLLDNGMKLSRIEFAECLQIVIMLARDGHEEVFKTLVSLGLPVDKTNPRKNTILHECILSFKLKAVKMLLLYSKQDLYAENVYGLSPMDSLEVNEDEDFADWLEQFLSSTR